MLEKYIDQSELKQKLLANEITWQDAQKLISSQKSPPWKTKEWKSKRDALIATHCAQCGTNEPPLVLQHTWQPKPFSLLFREIRGNYFDQWNVWKSEHPLEIDMSSIQADTNACPKCHSPTIRFRKTMKDWKCIAQESGVFCHHIFETPIRIVSEATRKNLSKVAWVKMLEEFDTVFGIGKQAVIMAIDQHARYISMQDTITLCKKCAFVADRTNMVLCEICKKNYHLTRYNRCAKCAGIHSEE